MVLPQNFCIHWDIFCCSSLYGSVQYYHIPSVLSCLLWHLSLNSQNPVWVCWYIFTCCSAIVLFLFSFQLDYPWEYLGWLCGLIKVGDLHSLGLFKFFSHCIWYSYLKFLWHFLCIWPWLMLTRINLFTNCIVQKSPFNNLSESMGIV